MGIRRQSARHAALGDGVGDAVERAGLGHRDVLADERRRRRARIADRGSRPVDRAAARALANKVPRATDCLRMPGCLVTPLGRCVNASLPAYATGFTDFHSVLTADAPHGPAFNQSADDLRYADAAAVVFFAANATYCGDADAVCAHCRATFREDARTLPRETFPLTGSFCVGAGGCVCAPICEVPTYRCTYEADNACPLALYTTALPPVYSAYANALQPSRRREPRAAPEKLVRPRATDTCEYYAPQDMQGCHRPRSCQDCLQKQGRGCMISAGACTSMKAYRWQSDFRVATAAYNLTLQRPISMVYQYAFPSTNTTYCPLADAWCAACRSEFSRSMPLYDAPSSEFCVGANDCVCLEYCEASLVSTTSQSTCGLATPPNSRLPAFLGSFGLAFVVWVALSITYAVLSRREAVDDAVDAVREAGVAVWRHMLDATPALPRLDHFGWNRHVARLQYKELLLLEGQEDLSPVYHPIDFDFVEPSAPEFDEQDDKTAPKATDPRALASAPKYTAAAETEDEGEGVDADASIATAPDFDNDTWRLPVA